ncbi:chromosome segregation protein SMC [Fulvivirgaceae bacterium PWU20]|uniref:Chromosome segregation protein SMC n=2 Tax=Chryseosolibacter indicus TaxID=2782351 RepID=A0ABS5VVB8_9BACT|nr:chromosome segregation protein SMC [Chryseosolibacter indicus]
MTDSTETTPTYEPAPRKNNKTTIIIALMAIIIIIQAIKIYLDSQEKHEVLTQLTSTEQELASTMQRLTEIRAELDQKIAEVQKLGGDFSDLQAAKNEIENELRRSKRATGKEIKALKDRVEGYELLLKNKDEEIEKLKTVNKELLTENTTLKTQKNVLGDSINRLSQTKQELASKVAIASQLKAENVKIVAVNDKGKERESPFKNRQLSQLKVDFNIAENSVAPIEGKKIMIRIIDENGQVLFDVARGSGTFIYNGKEEFYTASQEILFDNTRQRLTFLYDKGSEYPEGKYELEIYTDGYMMGKGQFTVK